MSQTILPSTVAVVFVLGLALGGCAALTRIIGYVVPPEPRTTYAKHLMVAQAGDPESQNLLGVMLFFGDGVPRNRGEAHWWFHLAAAQGNARAQQNLAVMHHLGAGVPRDEAEAAVQFRRAVGTAWRTIDEMIAAGLRESPATPAERTYAAFCAGCHGLNGLAAYVGSPSFALGESLEKSDAELLRSLRRGIGTMPGWEEKLPPADLVELLRFVRGLPREYERGIARVLRAAPPTYFLFGPMRANDLGYRLIDID